MSAVKKALSIGVNLTWLRPGVVGGSEEYTVRLLEGVGTYLDDAGLSLRLYGSSELAAAHPALAERYEFVAAPAIPGGRVGRVGLENTWLRVVSRNDVFVHHAGGTVPALRGADSIVTVHDLQPMEMPENFSWIKRRWLAAAVPTAVKASKLVLCPSPFTANRLHQLMAVPRERIRVVPHGHRSRLQVEAAVASRSAMLGEAYGRFLLYPAISYPHKRHIDLVRLLDRLGSAYADVKLVFTGRPGPEAANLLEESHRLGVANRVEVLGRVPFEELEALYVAAQALVFPSAYEGFGNPAVEAMALGCPVVVSDGGALPDVVGEAGLVYPVGDLDALTKAVRRVLDDRVLAVELGRLGQQRSLDFNRDIAAQTLADVYSEASDKRN